MAVLSLVLGIVALISLLTGYFAPFCIPLPLVLGVVAWVLGKNALTEIEAGQGNPSEKGIAQAGMIMGIISVALSVLGFCCLAAGVLGFLGLSAYFGNGAPWW
jgi:hypothetical protein